MAYRVGYEFNTKLIVDLYNKENSANEYHKLQKAFRDC